MGSDGRNTFYIKDRNLFSAIRRNCLCTGIHEMKAGNLVKCSPWTYNGNIGIILKVQDGPYCIGAWVQLPEGIKLIRLENLRRINEI